MRYRNRFEYNYIEFTAILGSVSPQSQQIPAARKIRYSGVYMCMYIIHVHIHVCMCMRPKCKARVLPDC